MRRTLLVCLLLSAVSLAVYWPVVHHDFVNYDDNCYVTQNRHVQAGLTWPGLAWAFGRLHGDGTYWHPLTWVSHMTDCQLFGLNPAGHHLVNLLFHTLNSLLLFLLFNRMTRAFWRAALLAALFALHPLQVDTVAWVAERKNLLSALFFFLTLWAYVRYAEARRQKAEGGMQNAECRIQNPESSTPHHAPRTPHPAPRTPPPSAAPGSKFDVRCSMLDVPPSPPSSPPPPPSAVPSSMLDVGCSMLDVRPSSARSTLHAPRSTPPSPRLWYCLTLALFVCGLMCKPVLVTLPFVLLLLDFWPLGRMQKEECRMQNAESVKGPGKLKPSARQFHPFLPNSQPSTNRRFHPSSFILHPLFLEKLPFLALSAVSCLITIAANRAVGAMLDAAAGFPLEIRLQNALFSYVKYLGQALWPPHLAVLYPYPGQFPAWRAVACALLLLAISAAALAAARRRPYLPVGWFWFLGVLVPFVGLLQSGAQAMADRFAYVPLVGLFLLLVWGAEELTRGWRRRRLVLAAAAAAVLVCCAALARRQTGYWQNSVTLFSHAVAVTGSNPRAQANLGMAFAAEGKTEEGIQHLLETIRLIPDDPIAYYAVALGRVEQGRFDDAIHCYETALSLKPDFPEALNNLAWIRAAHPDPQYRNGLAAVVLAERACRLTGQQEPLFIGTLAAAYAEAGRFADAVQTAERASDLAAAMGQPELADKNRRLLYLYRAGQPFHEADADRKP